jgi:acyl-CoA reductase-like NAD-dependent aldehyde dehydrogenase
MFSNAGQVCVAAKRVYVHADVYDALRDELVNYAASLTIGDGFDDRVQLGPVQNEMQYRRLQ